MGKKCKNCGGLDNPDDAVFCISCGQSMHIGKLTLTGNNGSAVCHVSTSVGRHIYEKLVGGENRYVCNCQYRLQFAEDIGVWSIIAEKGTPQLTLLNGKPCSEAPMMLRDGDSISLGSRNDSTKTTASVKVIIK